MSKILKTIFVQSTEWWPIKKLVQIINLISCSRSHFLRMFKNFTCFCFVTDLTRRCSARFSPWANQDQFRFAKETNSLTPIEFALLGVPYVFVCPKLSVKLISVDKYVEMEIPLSHLHRHRWRSNVVKGFRT